ncbi:MAG: hypothetical protein ABEJ57_03065 [Halobacteriaceae archaeon]
MELRRSWRQFRTKGRIQQGVMVVALLFGGVAVVAVAVGGYAAGTAVAAGTVETPLEAGALVPAAVFTGTVLFTTYLTAIQLGSVDQRDALLTTVPHADVVGGIVLASFVRIGGLFVVPLIVAAAAFAVGVGDLGAFVLVTGSLGVVLVAAFVLGFALGLGATHLFGQSRFLVRHRLAIGGIGFLAYLWLLTTNRIDDILEPVVTATQASPVAWFADLALISVVPAANPLQATAAGVGGVILVVASLRAVVWVAGVHWYADPVQAGPTETSSTSATRLAGVIGHPAAWVAKKSWVRARRSPLKLVYVVYPLFVLFQPAQEAIRAGAVTATLPAVVGVYGAWATGAAFGLNPLGDEGAVLPITVTTGVDGRAVVTGLVAAGLVPGATVTLVATAALAIASPLSPLAVVGVTVGAVALCVGAAGVATGIGVAFPRYEAATVARSRSVVVPSTWAFLTYSVVLLVLAAPAIATQVPMLTAAVAAVTGVSPTVVQIGGVVVALALVTPVSWYGTRYAARRFDEYTVG